MTTQEIRDFFKTIYTHYFLQKSQSSKVINNFPTEIWLHILRFCSIKTILRVAQVSKKHLALTLDPSIWEIKNPSPILFDLLGIDINNTSYPPSYHILAHTYSLSKTKNSILSKLISWLSSQEGAALFSQKFYLLSAPGSTIWASFGRPFNLLERKNTRTKLLEGDNFITESMYINLLTEIHTIPVILDQYCISSTISYIFTLFSKIIHAAEIASLRAFANKFYELNPFIFNPISSDNDLNLVLFEMKVLTNSDIQDSSRAPAIKCHIPPYRFSQLYFSSNTAPSMSYGINLSNLNLNFFPLTISNENMSALALTTLDLSYNELETLPETLTLLNNLRILLLTCNKLYKLPEKIGDLQNLTMLDVRENPALKSLPSTFLLLRNLNRFQIDTAQLQNLPVEWDTENNHLQENVRQCCVRGRKYN